MESSLTSSSSSSSKTTPFSINDILTKNNTTIFRRCSSSSNLSSLERKMHNENHRDCDQIIEPTDDLSHHLTNSMRFLKYSSHNYGHNSNIDQLHGTSQNFLCNNNHSTLNNNNHHGKNHSGNEVKPKRNINLDKAIKPIRFYNFPLMMERPLDMRRCNNDDDSGKCFKLINVKAFRISDP